MKKYSSLIPWLITIVFVFITNTLYADTFTVDNLGDNDNGLDYNNPAGQNTLRKCIRLANTRAGADTINFSVSGTISLTSALPAITDNGTVIDASSQWNGAWPAGQPGIELSGAGLSISASDCRISGLFIRSSAGSGVGISGNNNTVGGITADERNIISGNGEHGVYISGLNNTVKGNYIGTDANGIADLGNTMSGVSVNFGSNSTIGGTSAGERNIISGNDMNGVLINGTTANSNTVVGNYIGTDANGTADLGNTESGVFIDLGAKSNTIGGLTEGAGNIIAFNRERGVWVDGTSTDYNMISHNSIHDNTGLGIDLTGGGNDEIPAPTIASVNLFGPILSVSGTDAGANATVEMFEADSPTSEGMIYLGSLTADGSGSFSGPMNVAGKGLSIGDPLVATTTHTNNNTSEFSAAVIVSGEAGQGYALKEGWSLISFGINRCFYQGDPPTDLPACVELVNISSLGFANLADWFSSVITPDTAWKIVLGVDGAMDSSLSPIFHTLKYMSPADGYWVKIAEDSGDAVMYILGPLFDPGCAIPLGQGWNLVGYPINVGYYDTPSPPQVSVPDGTIWVHVAEPAADHVFQSIAGKYYMVISDYGAYDPSLPPAFSSLHYFAPGCAYWIKMNAESSLTYPSYPGE